MHGTNEVRVRVTGPGGVDLGRVTIAYVEDPISVDPITPVYAEAGRIFQAAPTRLNNITIRETNEGFFQPNDEIWLSVVGTQLGRPVGFSWADVAFDTSRIATVNTEDSGLVLDRGEIRRIQDVNGRDIDVVVFTVLQGSREVPAVITFTENFIFGNISDVVDYMLIVSGTRIAENNPTVYAATNLINGEERSAGYAMRNVQGLFDTLPYSTEIVRLAGIVEGPIQTPGPGVTPPPTTPPREFPPLVLYPQMGGIWSPSQQQTVAQPMITHGGVARIALRVFGDHIGADIMTMTADRVVIISGLAVNGERMTVHLPVGSNTATIIYNDRGVSLENVDIATWVIQNSPTGQNSGAAGTVQTVIYNNLTYLPARFLSYVFGFNIEWATGHVTTITPRV